MACPTGQEFEKKKNGMETRSAGRDIWLDIWEQAQSLKNRIIC